MAEETKTEPMAQRFTPDEVIAKQRNKQLLIMVVVIVVLAGLVAIARATEDVAAPLKEVMLVGGTREAPALTQDSIKRIEIWKGDSKAHFQLNRDGDNWVVPSRYNAPASEADVEALIAKLVSAARLNRPATTDAAQFALYGLDDESAVHLRVEDTKGNVVFHLLLGHGEASSRDFVRLAGDGAPEGIFELTGLGGKYDTLYGMLNLDDDGQPRAGSWIDLSNVKALGPNTDVQTIELHDGDSVTRFAREPNSDPADDKWQLISPREGKADGQAVHAIIDVLRTYTVNDIAGPDTDAPKYGVAMPKKEIVYTYLVGEKLVTAHLAIGDKNDANEVAVWLKTVNKGKFIYWGGDFIISRVFRSVADMMTKERVELIPAGVSVNSVTLQDTDQTTRLVRVADGASSSWKLEQPLEIEADRLEVSNLLTGLNALQGYRTGGEIDRVALGLGAGVSKRYITVVYPSAQAGDDDSDGDDTPDAEKPDAEKPDAERPNAEKPAETKPELKTATLYFGTIVQEEVPVLRVTDDGEQLFWLKAEAVGRLFQAPADFVKLSDMQVIKPGQKVTGILITNGDAILQLTTDAKGDKLWHIKQPWDEVADQSEAGQMLRAVASLQGAKLATPLDKQKYALGAGASTRELELTVGSGESAETTTLYFGEPFSGMTTGLLKHGDTEEFYLFKPADLFQFFVSPKDLRVLPMFSGKVRHILISWKGHTDGVKLKDPNRTEAEARALANEIMQRANKGEDFVELQKQYNEDGDATHVYAVSPTESLVKPFLRLSSELKVGEVGVVESAFGFHVIKRIE